MGVVYKARDTHLDRFVAIKLMPPDRTADPERKQRFIHEAKAASALNHPNIVHVYDISSDGGREFIAMEYLAGKTLEQQIGRKGLALDEALKCAIQIADALAAAHAVGIIHRDLKPANVMVTDEGVVKVVDFGVAKLTEQRLPEDSSTATMDVKTEEGAIIGTAVYMSPEQVAGKKVDARSDIFSFGSVLYEMVTGRRAFPGESKIAILSAILHVDPKPLAEGLQDVAPELQRIIARCLRKAPERRFHHMVDLKVALEELRDEMEQGALTSGAICPIQVAVQPDRWPQRWFGLAVTVAAVLVAVIGLAVWWLGARSGPQAAVWGPVRPLTTYSGLEYEPALSPDGKQVAFAWNGEHQDNFDIYVRLVEGGSALRLTTDAAADHSPAWSPDGSHLAFVRDNAVYLIPALGGVERQLVQFPRGGIYNSFYRSSLSWSADGRFLAFSGTEDNKSPAAI